MSINPISKRPQILYSCYTHKNSEGEHIIPQHVFSYTFTGTAEVFVEGKMYVFKDGDFRFFRKNQLSKFTKWPPPGGEYKVISIAFDQEVLMEIAEEFNFKATLPYTGDNVLRLQPDPLLKNFMDSLTPYMDGSNHISIALTHLKVKEAVMILLQTNPALKDILFDFSEPAKLTWKRI